MTAMFRSHLLRIRPNGAQRAEFERILTLSCDLYNAALQERRDAWRMAGKVISRYDQQKQLTELRREYSDIAAVSAVVLREPLRRVDLAFQALFRRARAGEKPGYPRFRSRDRYDSFTFSDHPHVTATHIRIPNVGLIRYKTSPPIIGAPKAATVKRIGKRWLIRLVCDVGPAPEKCAVSSAVGIDLGVSTFAALSDGTLIENPRFTKQHEDRIARANRSLARKKRGSANRKKAKEQLRRAHQRAAGARRNFSHHVSKHLIQNYDLIAHEDLNIRNMVRGNLSKSILDAAWGELIFQLTYKAESAGKWVVPVNPKGTSQRCSGCGNVVPKDLSERWHSCPCGVSLDRDVNAAKNVLMLGASIAAVRQDAGGIQ